MTAPSSDPSRRPSVTALPSEEPLRGQRRRRRVAVLFCAALVLTGGTGSAWLWSAVREAREAARRTQCRGHLFKIGLALHNYHDQFGSFPPAYVADGDGRPMHSWRVLLLPYLGEMDVYRQYRFDEPWDGPNNRQLARRMPAVYRCPSDRRLAGGGDAVVLTSYVALTGPGTAFDGARATTRGEITDDRSQTVLVVESPAAAVHWMQPVDLPADEFCRLFAAGVGPVTHGGTNVTLAEGRSRYVPAGLSAATWRAVVTIAGGEKIEGF